MKIKLEILIKIDQISYVQLQSHYNTLKRSRKIKFEILISRYITPLVDNAKYFSFFT